MTGFQAPWEQKWAADQAALMQRVAVLERQMAQASSLAANTMQKLYGSVATGTIPSIVIPVPAGYSTLRVAWSGRGDNAGPATYMCVRLNGDSGNNYLWQINQANNSSLTGSGNSGGTTNLIEIGTLAGATATAGYQGSGEFVIPNASGSTYKAPSGYSSSMNSTTSGYAGAYGGLWLNTAAVTSITLLAAGANLVAGSAAYLYGMP